jgi:tRNA-modifying protein YgfZ
MTNTSLTDRAIIRLSGEGVRDFLQGLITHDVLGDLPVWAGLLTPQGKALFDFLVWAAKECDGSDDLLIDCEKDQAEALAKRLSLYRLRRPITIAIDQSLAVHWSLETGKGVPDPRDAALGQRWIAPPDGEASGWHAHRLALGIVEGRVELGSDQSLWLECNAREQNGVSFTKGCYIGQENTARMHHRSKANRMISVVAADTDPGDDVRVWYPDLKLAVKVQRKAG